ncbi:primosomal protein N' [Denitrobacterium detoxificans]|uniref:Replication restart protein PriA n=1 Tax=Denitrobacterium detoxificans TaxID=79604 RepID=A0A172RY08_9ACTN|nr:primosomal protein N' [Denitrobacterium detoxificans]ANE22617.1 primosomal protein N' [Denitrobacterium detoxificans]SEO91733.1 replication restart DNA helicase PriA [Denitrobacterium detoxificans]
MRTAQVVLDIPTQALDSAYTYIAPDHLDDFQVGCSVLVPFGGRQAVGFVMCVSEYAEDDLASLEADAGCKASKLKPIASVLSKPFFDENGAACAEFLANRYVAPLSSCVRLFTPPGGVPRMVRGAHGWRLEQPTVGEVDDRWVRLLPAAAEFTPRKGAVKQEAILQALSAGELRVAELTAEYGSVSSVLKSLEKRGVLAVESRRRMRGMERVDGAGTQMDYRSVGFEPTAKPQLTEGQERALAEIEQAYNAHCGRVVLLDGVTGSGKTEVYLQAIERVIKAGQTAIVLVPEISLTPQTVARFRGRFGDMVAVLHSRMSVGERYDQWDFIRSGDARVVVGARSALFSPLANLGLIVIDEEHEGSYKQDQAPRYVSRDVAAWMAQHVGGALVLGSATPSIETLHRVHFDEAWSCVELPERANGKPMPRVDVVDMANEFGSGSRSMFSRKLQNALKETIDQGRKAVLMLNQRGFASFLLCRECGFVPTCPSCSTSLTYHERGASLVCHHCGYTMAAPALCPECGSPYLKKFGAGTQRVEAELRGTIEAFGSRYHVTCSSDAEAPSSMPISEGDIVVDLIRMDADTTSHKGAHRALLERFASADAAVLLGTQMIAKGLDFDDVTLVGVINADTQLRLPDFRSGERTFDLIQQVAGRAGRADLPGRVIVQTYNASSAAIRAAARYDRAAFLKDELPKRKALQYPPYVRLADVRIWGKNEGEVRDHAIQLYEQLRDQLSKVAVGDWLILPPVPCVLSRLRGNYRYHISVKAPLGSDIATVLAPVFRARKAQSTVSVAIDVDPQSLL